MSIGKQWKKRRGDQDIASQDHQAAAFRKEAEAAIAKIPGLIDRAVTEKRDSIDVLGRYLSGEDVACKDVDELVDSGGRLRAEHLAGTALIIFEWCAKNDLECYIGTGPKIPLNGCEFELRARPV